VLSIGAPELIVIFVILAMLAVPVVVAVFFVVTQRKNVARTHANAASSLLQCRACGRPLAPHAPACPECGEPRAPLRG
jgi:hypothetical protein